MYNEGTNQRSKFGHLGESEMCKPLNYCYILNKILMRDRDALLVWWIF